LFAPPWQRAERTFNYVNPAILIHTGNFAQSYIQHRSRRLGNAPRARV
jgi:hypothetical protein